MGPLFVFNVGPPLWEPDFRMSLLSSEDSGDMSIRGSQALRDMGVCFCRFPFWVIIQEARKENHHFGVPSKRTHPYFTSARTVTL